MSGPHVCDNLRRLSANALSLHGSERIFSGGTVNRYQLEHIIRASGGVADSKELIVIGSQAILGQFPDAPAECIEPVPEP